MPLRKIAVFFGIFFVVFGIAGFVHGLTPHGRLFGLFAVDPEHNLVHFLTGFIALLVCNVGELPAWRYFRAFTAFYALFSLLGAVVPHGPLLGVIAHNVHDIWLHGLITLVFAYFAYYRGPRLGYA